MTYRIERLTTWLFAYSSGHDIYPIILTSEPALLMHPTVQQNQKKLFQAWWKFAFLEYVQAQMQDEPL